MSTKLSVFADKRNKRKPWVVRWSGELDFDTGKSKRYAKSFRLKVDAEAFASQKAVEFSQGGRRDDPKETLKPFCDKWSRLNNSHRPATQKLYSYTIERLLNYFGPDCLLQRITTNRARVFIAGLKSLKGGELSDWTKHRTLRQCKTIFYAAIEDKRIATNPFKNKSISLSEPDVPNFHYLNAEEYNRLLDNTATLRQRCLYALCYTGGCRFSEAVSRQWGDLDFDTGELRIACKKATDQHPEFVLKGRKGKRFPRPVTLPSQTLTLLRKLRMQNIDSPYIFFGGDDYENLMVKWQDCQKQDKPWRWQFAYLNANRELRRHATKAGIKIKPDEKFSIHTLRKCAGKNWATINRDIKVTQGLMGHRSYQTTMKYYDQVEPEDREKAAQKIEAMLKVS